MQAPPTTAAACSSSSRPCSASSSGMSGGASPGHMLTSVQKKPRQKVAEVCRSLGVVGQGVVGQGVVGVCRHKPWRMGKSTSSIPAAPQWQHPTRSRESARGDWQQFIEAATLIRYVATLLR
jgi:hypothetical protein